MCKPFLKWIGGKTQILNDITRLLPKECNNYHELFIGGGSVLIKILTMKNEGKFNIKGDINAYDINKNLINTYSILQKEPENMYSKVSLFFENYNKSNDKEAYYYSLRQQFNSTEEIFIKSCMFIVLNKLGFRGMYREGPNGFNVPFGNYKKIQFMSEDDFIRLSVLVKDVNFIHKDFKDSIQLISKGDFVYLDPPYIPLNSKSFVKYTKADFNMDTHTYLFDKVLEFDNNDIKFVMCNNDSDLLKKLFEKYNIDIVVAKRRINSKNPESSVNELIISN